MPTHPHPPIAAETSAVFPVASTADSRGTVGTFLLVLEEIRVLKEGDEGFPDVDEGLLPLDDIVL